MRHADVHYFADPQAPVAPEDVVLSPAGVEQALSAGRTLREVRFDRVLTSGLPRTDETARLVVEQLVHAPADGTLHGWHDLQEYRPGDVSAIPDAELEESFLGPFRGTPGPGAAYLRGETVGSLSGRVIAAMDRLYADSSWHTLLLVLHGGVNRAILSWALAGSERFFAQFEQSPACVNVIDGEPGAFVIRAVNTIPYDPVHMGPRTTTVEQILEEYRMYRKVAK